MFGGCEEEVNDVVVEEGCFFTVRGWLDASERAMLVCPPSGRFPADASAHTTSHHHTMSHEVIIPDNAKAVCNLPLPTLDPAYANDGSILLFYQYVEPLWTRSQHKAALKKVIEIGTKFNITGRGRVAQEGLNCTLTGKPNDIRSFCYGLRDWDELFNETDFKITDGVATDKLFKSLSIRKTNELVAYGLAGGEFRDAFVWLYKSVITHHTTWK